MINTPETMSRLTCGNCGRVVDSVDFTTEALDVFRFLLLSHPELFDPLPSHGSKEVVKNTYCGRICFLHASCGSTHN